MQVVRRDQVIMVDVDDTLIRRGNYKELHVDGCVFYQIPHPLRNGQTVERIPLRSNIQLIKDMHARGRYIIVWSAGGWQWAEAVVKSLGLEPHVHLILEKPIAYVDDLEANEFMGQRIFLND